NEVPHRCARSEIALRPNADRGGPGRTDTDEVPLDDILRRLSGECAGDLHAGGEVARKDVAVAGGGAAHRVGRGAPDLDAYQVVRLLHGACGVGADKVAGDEVGAALHIDAVAIEAVDRQAADGAAVGPGPEDNSIHPGTGTAPVQLDD